MAIVPIAEATPRDILKSVRPHKGLICYRPDTDDYVKYSVYAGEPTPQGFIPLQRSVGVIRVGIIYLKGLPGIENGYYAIYPRDLYRRRIDARPGRKLSVEEATLLLGGKLEHLGLSEASAEAVRSTLEQGSVGSSQDEELAAADVCFKEQVEALLSAEDS